MSSPPQCSINILNHVYFLWVLRGQCWCICGLWTSSCFLLCTSMEVFVPGKSASPAKVGSEAQVVCVQQDGAGCHGRGNEKRKEGQEWIKWKCEWEWAKLSFKVAIFVLECCAGRSISISAFSYDSLSCLTSVDCHVKGLILASLRQPNMPFAHSYPEVCNFCTEEVAGEPDFPVYWEWTDISKEFESSRHQSVFCSVPGEDWVYPACLSEWVVIT